MKGTAGKGSEVRQQGQQRNRQKDNSTESQRGKVLILGGGCQQLPAIRKARELGLHVLVADYNENPPGRAEADEFHQISTTDREQILELALREQVDGVMTFASDPAQRTVSYVAEQLGLPGESAESAEILGDKARLREYLRRLQIPTPRSMVLDGGAESLTTISDELESVPFPLLIKPLRSSGSRGITLVEELDHACLQAAYEKAAGIGAAGCAIAEEYIEYGYPHLIGGDIVVRDGRIAVLGLMDCIREEDHPLVPCGKIFPSAASDGQKEQIWQTLERVVQDLQIRNAEMNVELILGADGRVFPIEIALRAGGNGIPLLLSDALGMDLIQEGILLATREEVRRQLKEDSSRDNCEWQDHEGENHEEDHEREEHQKAKADSAKTDTMKRKRRYACDNSRYSGLLEADDAPAYVSYNLHARQHGTFNGYTIAPAWQEHLYRTELFKREGDPVEPYIDASGIIGVLYFRFDSREELEQLGRPEDGIGLVGGAADQIDVP